MTPDKRYVIKLMKKADLSLLKNDIFINYYKRVTHKEGSLMGRILGVFHLTSISRCFIIMENIL